MMGDLLLFLRFRVVSGISDIMRAQHRTHRRFDTVLWSSVVEAWTPTIDGDLIDMHALKGLREGRSASKEVMIGHTSAEGEGFVYKF